MKFWGIFDYVQNTHARQSPNKFGITCFVFLTTSKILMLGKAQINLALRSLIRIFALLNYMRY